MINYSAPTPDVAVEKFKTMPVAVVYPWKPEQKNARHKGALIVRCPAEYKAVRGCADCGGGVPLCARLNRNYIIGFEPHGAQKKKAADPNIKGGCYAANGHTNLHWTATTEQEQGDETDAERVTSFCPRLAAAGYCPPPYSGRCDARLRLRLKQLNRAGSAPRLLLQTYEAQRLFLYAILTRGGLPCITGYEPRL